MSEIPPTEPVVTPPVEPTEPVVAPKVEPAVIPEPPKKDDTIAVKEYAKLMREHNALKKVVDTLNKDKKDMQRATLLSQITIIDPKLAELYKDSDPSTLEVVLKTSQLIGSGFPTRQEPGKDTEQNGTAYDWEKRAWNIV